MDCRIEAIAAIKTPDTMKCIFCLIFLMAVSLCAVSQNLPDIDSLNAHLKNRNIINIDSGHKQIDNTGNNKMLDEWNARNNNINIPQTVELIICIIAIIIIFITIWHFRKRIKNILTQFYQKSLSLIGKVSLFKVSIIIIMIIFLYIYKSQSGYSSGNRYQLHNGKIFDTQTGKLYDAKNQPILTELPPQNN